MSDIPLVTAPGFVGAITGFPLLADPYTNIQPFTYRDGLTYLEVQECLRDWLQNTLAPGIDTNITALQTAWDTESASIITAVNAAIDSNNADIASLVTEVNALVASLNTTIDSANTAATNASASAAASATSATTAATSATTAGTSAANAATSAANAASAASTAVNSALIHAKSILEVYEDFSIYPDGPLPATTAAGQPWSLAIGSATTPNAVPIIKNGSLTYDNNDYGGVYAILQLDGDVVRAGCEFSFSSHTMVGGEFAIAIMNEDIGVSYAAGHGIPQAAMHLQVRPMLIDYDVNAVRGSAVQSVTSVNYNADGSDWIVPDKRYFVDVFLDKPNNTAYFRTPQGLTFTATDPMIGAPGHKYVFFEPYRNAANATDAATQALVSFHKVWADSHNVVAGSSFVLANEKRARPAVVANNITVQADQALTTGAIALHNMSITLPAPPSMAFDVEMSVPIVMTAAGQVRIGVMNEGSTTWANETLPDGSTPQAWMMVSTGSQLVDQTFHARFRITFTGKKVGQACVIPIGAQTTGTGVVKYGTNISPRMRVTPLPLI